MQVLVTRHIAVKGHGEALSLVLVDSDHDASAGPSAVVQSLFMYMKSAQTRGGPSPYLVHRPVDPVVPARLRLPAQAVETPTRGVHMRQVVPLGFVGSSSTASPEASSMASAATSSSASAAGAAAPLSLPALHRRNDLRAILRIDPRDVVLGRREVEPVPGNEHRDLLPAELDVATATREVDDPAPPGRPG